MRSQTHPITIGLVAACLGFGAGLWAGRGLPTASHEVSAAGSPAAEAVIEEKETKAKRDRVAQFPTVVMATSKMPDYAGSPYPDWLVKVKCRGMPGDLKKDFFAVFQCVRGHSPLEAAGLHVRMRLRLDMVPIENQPEPTKRWPLADDVDDFSLPVFWVRDFEHDEPALRLAVEAGRERFARLAIETVLKSPVTVPCGDVQTPFYFYGANWEIYKAGAEARLTGLRPGSPMLAVKHLHDWLRDRGVRLVFAPVPQSASIFPDVALGRFDGASLKGNPANSPVRQMLDALRKEGVAVIDFAAELSQTRTEGHEGWTYLTYLPNDTHWSSGGARKAAVQAAKLLGDEGLIPPAAQPDGTALFQTTLHSDPLKGDIGLVSAVANLGVSIEPVPTLYHRVVPVTEEAKKLLEDPGVGGTIHCVGDSYLFAHRQLQAGFVDHLVKETGRPVHVSAGPASAQHVAMREWLREGGFKEAKVLLWMPAERFLGMDEWIDVLAEPVARR